MKDERGFTLVEVLASLVIISLVLTSFMAIFSNTNALAVSNSEKLVVINLADSYLERFKVNPEDTINIERPNNSKIAFPPSMISCPKAERINNGCRRVELFKPAKINGKEYMVEFQISQDRDEKILSLYDVVVKVTSSDSGLSSSVEGYVHYEE